MKRIETLSEINTLVSAYMKKGVLSNNYIMQDKYQTYIDAGTLYYEQSDSILALLLDYDNCWRVYYHIIDTAAEIQLPSDKPLVMELVYRNENEALNSQLEYWSSKEFSKYIERSRMNGCSKDLKIADIDSRNIKFAEDKHAETIQEMIAEAFDPYLGCVPGLNDVKDFITKKEIIIAEADDGKVLGVLHIGGKGTAWFVRHLVVHAEARKRGVGKKLLAFYTNMLLDYDNSKIQLWVKKDNTAARALYESVGFKYDGWESAGLIKK